MKKTPLVTALVMVVVLASCGPAPAQGSGRDRDTIGEVRNEAPAKTIERSGQGEKGRDEKAPEVDRPAASQASKIAAPAKERTRLEPPRDKSLRLTVPKMAEIKNDEIPSGMASDEHLFRDYAAAHLRYTGFPWQEEANVFIAGHRIGYPGTDSDKAFYDIEDLRNGDKLYVEDSMGRKYTYEVFDKLVVLQTNLSVLAPIEGENILSLQSCTLPDYSKRVIYQARLTNVDA